MGEYTVFVCDCCGKESTHYEEFVKHSRLSLCCGGETLAWSSSKNDWNSDKPHLFCKDCDEAYKLLTNKLKAEVGDLIPDMKKMYGVKEKENPSL